MTRLPTILLTLALHGAACAGPVASEQPDAVAPVIGASPGAQAHVAAASAVGQGLPELGHAASTAASAATGSALVLEMLKEADAGAAGHDTVRQPRRDAARAANPASAASPDERALKAKRDDDPWGLRDIGKTALAWAKSAIPWLRSEDDETGTDAVHKPGDWSASSLGHEGPRGAARAPEAGSHAQPEAEVVYGEARREPQGHVQSNLVREIIGVLRLVLEHPMTWLVVSLFVIGGIVVKRIDRRPTK